MHPAAFQDYAVDLLKNTPDVQRVQSLNEAGDTKHPYGLAVTVAGREVRWQLIGQLAEGAKHEPPTAAVQGSPAPFEAAPVTAAPDAWLAGVIGAAESPEIATLDVWSTREGGDGQHGVTITWHNGEKTFVRKL
ncbi:hypothetical protein DCW30_05970 [Streptomyces alfalfae]|uniref:Uncharacterized protein n=1 Tax=Streptomyces alfalfae TaxID=1642299 RepID=A0ABM6GW83_9ACTN|nr:hypothetical protein [Streptomyces alfalfae]APY88157.1 hypothetical protein A7J05_22905 [Streptomyces alfalfae]AYA18549.1 hypothetical protein D3X13_22015 [Streptomyces fradiae]RXX46570.1 hypothetical protein DCW30_05970 [Streptomyces alfalfae]RZM90083.1 hypothetical protein D4104_25905 [Streptomyces alfalfae]